MPLAGKSLNYISHLIVGHVNVQILFLVVLCYRELCLDRCDALTDEISFLEENYSRVTNELGRIKQKILSCEKNVQNLQNEKLKLSSDADELSQAVIEEVRLKI